MASTLSTPSRMVCTSATPGCSGWVAAATAARSASICPVCCWPGSEPSTTSATRARSSTCRACSCKARQGLRSIRRSAHSTSRPRTKTTAKAISASTSNARSACDRKIESNHAGSSNSASLTCPICWPRPSAQRPTCPSIRAISPPSSSGVITGSGSAATGASAGAGSPSVSSAVGATAASLAITLSVASTSARRPSSSSTSTARRASWRETSPDRCDDSL